MACLNEPIEYRGSLRRGVALNGGRRRRFGRPEIGLFGQSIAVSARSATARLAAGVSNVTLVRVGACCIYPVSR